MLTHEQIWQALDALASKHGLSASGLAKAAGLDPTTFNRSKRLTPDGRQRWPSTESIAKVLVATGETLDDFVLLVGPGRTVSGPPVPLIGLGKVGPDSFDSAGRPAGAEWDGLLPPSFPEGEVFALEVIGDGFLPVYRDGDALILSLTETPRRGDRVIVRMTDGLVLSGVLRRETARGPDLQPFSGQADISLERRQVAAIYRILWARQ
ncbi:MAG: helix-turn-helix transcriptional regulator [Proteobacteria bacterium]|nr:helix-turn-helix transcriptional regulator [Pseudomonadota bacterium]